MEAGNGKARYLAGIDLTYRYTPLSQAQYRGLIWGTEVLYNSEDWNVGDDDDPGLSPRRRLRSLQLRRGAPDAALLSRASCSTTSRRSTARQGDLTSYSPYFTIWLSEFQRLRLQYTYLTRASQPREPVLPAVDRILGSHVHGFRDR